MTVIPPCLISADRFGLPTSPLIRDVSLASWPSGRSETVTTLSERLSFSPGVDTFPAPSDEAKRLYYPRPGWAPLPEAGARALLVAGIPRPSKTVYLLSIAQHLTLRFRQLSPRPFVGRPQACRRNRHSPTSSCVIDEILTLFDHTFLADERYYLETVVNVGPCRSTTADPLFGKGIGLHLDSGTSLSLTERHRAIPRCGLNLGTCPRYFVFVNLTAETIGKLLPGALSEDELNALALASANRFLFDVPELSGASPQALPRRRIRSANPVPYP